MRLGDWNLEPTENRTFICEWCDEESEYVHDIERECLNEGCHGEEESS